eukprot:1877969-Rhodomonas_salina.2
MVVFLHKAKSGQVVADLMLKARAKIKSWPACMRSDMTVLQNTIPLRSDSSSWTTTLNTSGPTQESSSRKALLRRWSTRSAEA